MTRTARELRIRRHRRVRRKVSGSAERPRLAVFRSNRHLYAQVIDDGAGRTLAAASTRDPALRSRQGSPTDLARGVGELVAERAVRQGIHSVVFDRGGFLYHGRVKALADGAREQGLEL